jgi:hypothetical protein
MKWRMSLTVGKELLSRCNDKPLLQFNLRRPSARYRFHKHQSRPNCAEQRHEIGVRGREDNRTTQGSCCPKLRAAPAEIADSIQQCCDGRAGLYQWCYSVLDILRHIPTL